MLTNFNGELNRLTEILGLFDPEIVAAGTAMFQYTVAGSLNTDPVAEGDEVPLSKYTVTPTQLDPITVKPYRKLTTAQAILKGGYENAIEKTDRKMIGQVRNGILTDFFTFLATAPARRPARAFRPRWRRPPRRFRTRPRRTTTSPAPSSTS